MAGLPKFWDPGVRHQEMVILAVLGLAACPVDPRVCRSRKKCSCPLSISNEHQARFAWRSVQGTDLQDSINFSEILGSTSHLLLDLIMCLAGLLSGSQIYQAHHLSRHFCNTPRFPEHVSEIRDENMEHDRVLHQCPKSVYI